MCGGGRPPAPDTRAQEESLKLQREQMDMQRQQMELQNKQYAEQLAISTAPPPPPPNAAADAAAGALDATAAAATATTVRQGVGRRKMRTDTPAGGAGGLSVPGV
jgi:hypothetical protein